MSQLQSLPTELLLAIASHLPQPGLSALVHSCRHIHEAVTPLLYESVFWQQDYHARRLLSSEASFSEADLENHHRGRFNNRQASAQFSRSRIFDLDAFTCTLLSSESLRSLVKNVDLRWEDKAIDLINVDDSVHRCLQALESSYLRTLHLSPAAFHFEIPTRPAVTSLAFDYSRCCVYRAFQHGGDLNRLYTLFKIPSLIHFCMDGWPVWGDFSNTNLTRATPDRVAVSNIESLSLRHSDGPGEDLREVLSWPKALKRFTFIPHLQLPPKSLTLVQSELQYVLQHQRQTLEYLNVRIPNDGSGTSNTFGSPYIRGRRLATGSDICKSLVLDDFPALKHLSASISPPMPRRCGTTSFYASGSFLV